MDPDQTARMHRLVWIHAGRKRTRDASQIIFTSPLCMELLCKRILIQDHNFSKLLSFTGEGKPKVHLCALLLALAGT
jgi:hypothetical protein